jgi:hypothetical protein
VEAHIWLTVATANGVEMARDSLIFIEQRMTPEQKQKALILAAERLQQTQKYE